MDLVVKSRSFFLINIKEPIEQNVHGTKGVYELVYFMKESKSLERFRKQAQEFDKLIESKTEEDIERLVSLGTCFFIYSLMVSDFVNISKVLEDIKAQCSCLWRRHFRFFI